MNPFSCATKGKMRVAELFGRLWLTCPCSVLLAGCRRQGERELTLEVSRRNPAAVDGPRGPAQETRIKAMSDRLIVLAALKGHNGGAVAPGPSHGLSYLWESPGSWSLVSRNLVFGSHLCSQKAPICFPGTPGMEAVQSNEDSLSKSF